MGTTKGKGQFCNGDSATCAKKNNSEIGNHYKSALKATTSLSLLLLWLCFFLVFKKDLPLPFNLQSLAKHSRSNIGAEGGPPPFVPFGQVRTIVIMKVHFSKKKLQTPEENNELETRI